MRLAISMFFSLLFCPCTFSAAYGQTSAQPDSSVYFICAEGGNQNEFYVTGIFRAPAEDFLKVSDAFKRYVQQQFGHNQMPTINACQQQRHMEGAQTYRNNLLAREKKNPRIKVIETDWTYAGTGEAQAEPDPAPPQRPAQGDAVYFCSGFLGATPKAYYFSDNFEGPTRLDTIRVRNDFLGFIKEKYAPGTREASGGCQASDKAPEVARFKEAGRTIVETGWKPTALPITQGNH